MFRCSIGEGWRCALALSGGVLLLLLEGCGLNETSFRYRTTVTVVASGHTYTGSSVCEYSVTPQLPGFAFQSPPETRGRGEATLVELPGNRVLVALTHGWDRGGPPAVDPDWWTGWYAIFRAPNVPQPPNLHADVVVRALGSLRSSSPVVLNPSELPILVTFADRLAPDTVAVVDPANPAAALGRDVQSVRVSVSVTRDPLFSEMIDEHLPWIKSLAAGDTLDGQVHETVWDSSMTSNIDGSYFIRRR